METNMRIMVLEADLDEQAHIANLLNEKSVDIQYETTVTRAINALGLSHVDLALIDADQSDKQNKICDWKDLISFLDKLDVNYTVFSSNGKVGIKDGQKIISIDDIPNAVTSEVSLQELKGI
jgi:hypothetical protein